MVKEGIVLGNIVSEGGIEANHTKIEDIEKLPIPRNLKALRYFLDHVGFDYRFIKDFFIVSRPLSSLLVKDFHFALL